MKFFALASEAELNSAAFFQRLRFCADCSRRPATCRQPGELFVARGDRRIQRFTLPVGCVSKLQEPAHAPALPQRAVRARLKAPGGRRKFRIARLQRLGDLIAIAEQRRER